MGSRLLYFAYTARIEPASMAEACPSATFAFIAHLPGWGLEFPLDGNGWNGGLPTARPTAGSTVWGVVYELGEDDLDRLEAVERSEGRVRSTVEAMDRMGRRHTVVTHVAPDSEGRTLDPSTEYIDVMLRGSRHWSLPAGWIAGLEEVLGTGF